jgi:hypothetical protein
LTSFLLGNRHLENIVISAKNKSLPVIRVSGGKIWVLIRPFLINLYENCWKIHSGGRGSFLPEDWHPGKLVISGKNILLPVIRVYGGKAWVLIWPLLINFCENCCA